MIILPISIILILLVPVNVYAISESGVTEELIDEVIKMGDYRNLDQYTYDLSQNKITFEELIRQIINGKENISEYVCDYVFDIFLYEITSIKETIISMLSLIIVFSIFNKIATSKGGYVVDVGFLMTYAALMTLLLSGFDMVGNVVNDGLNNITNLMSAIIPAFASTLVLTGKITTASAFYTVSCSLVYVLEYAIKTIIIPAIHVYILLELLNNIYVGKKLSRLSQLLYKSISFALKISIAVVSGISVIQSLINSAKDQVNESLILRSFSLIPGIGKVAGASGEILLSCAVLVKSTVGIAVLILLVIITVFPLVKVLIFEFTYKLMAAILEPIADKRIVDGIHGVACAGSLYVKTIICCLVLFFIVIATVCLTSNGIT